MILHTRPQIKKLSSTQLKGYLSPWHIIYHIFLFCIASLTWLQDPLATDDWKDQVVNKGNKPKKSNTTENAFEQFDRFFGTKPMTCDKCLDIIAWYGRGLN